MRFGGILGSGGRVGKLFTLKFDNFSLKKIHSISEMYLGCNNKQIVYLSQSTLSCSLESGWSVYEVELGDQSPVNIC